MGLEQIDPQIQALQARVAELEQENESFASLRDRLRQVEAQPRQAPLLYTVAQVANLLLRSQDYTTVLPDVLRLLGEAVGSDRCTIAQDVLHLTLGVPAAKVIVEWCQEGVMSGFEATPELADTIPWQDLPELYEQLLQGETANYLVSDLSEPNRSLFMAQDVTSIVYLPIMANGKGWGQIGFDNCGEPRLFDEAEIAILRIAADSIATAIECQAKDDELLRLEQERSQELERLNAELQQRDRILAATAQVANTLFSIDPFEEAVKAALQILGEGLETDHINLVENFNPPADLASLWWRVLFEWDSPDIVPQLSHSDAAQGRYDEIGWIGESLQRQQVVSYLIEDAPEPFRSGQIAIGVKSTHVIPIFVEGKWWGVLGLDDCRAAKQRSAAELDALKIAANCFGSAIERQRTQQALLQAEQARSQELTKANEALKRSLDALASEPSLDKFLGQVLMAIAEQFNSPTAEYWYHVEDIAYIGMMSWRNEIYDRAKIAKEYPTHPGILGFKVLPEMIHGATLQTRKNYFIIENFPTNAFVKNLKWMIENRLYKEINVPMVLGEHCVGALIVRMSKKQEITTQKIELAQALAHQATLVVQLTRLAEEAKQAAILEERNRMAGEIHDTLAQAFTGIVMQLQAAERFLVTNATQAKTCLNRAQVLAKTGLTEARRSVWALYTDIDEDLFQLLAETVHALAADTDFEIQTILEGTPYSLAAEHSLNLQRIAQESITNALRHAQARRIVLTLTYDPAFIQLQIHDDGQGFDSTRSSPGFGLIGIQQRCDHLNASLTLHSQPGLGTLIQVILPIRSDRHDV